MNIRVINFKKEKEIYKKTIDITKLKERDIEKKAVKLADQISKEIFDAINKR